MVKPRSSHLKGGGGKGQRGTVMSNAVRCYSDCTGVCIDNQCEGRVCISFIQM